MATCQPKRIHPHQRVRRILIQVQPAAQPYRILRGETPHLRFVVAEQVVVQAAFVILVLPGVAQRLLILRALPLRRAGHRLALQLAEGIVLPGPAQVARRVGHFQRRAVQIGVIPVNIRRAAVARLLQRRQWAPRAGRIVAPAAAAAVVALLLQQPVALPQETGRLFGFALVAHRFATAAAQRVVMVLRLEFALRAAAVRLHQPVVGVVAVVLFVQAVAPADQVAPGVVTVKQFLPVRQAVVGDRRQRQVRGDVALGVYIDQFILIFKERVS